MGSDGGGVGTTVGGKGETTAESQREKTCPSGIFLQLLKRYRMGGIGVFYLDDVLGLIFFHECPSKSE